MGQAANIARKHWITEHGIATFDSARAYGVLGDGGCFALASNGQPMTWNTKATAAEIAKYADAMVKAGQAFWIPVYSSLEEVKEIANNDYRG